MTKLRVSAVVLATLWAILSSPPTTASIVLIYDSTNLQLSPGGSVQIGATLTTSVEIHTDEDGTWGSLPLFVGQYLPVDAMFSGSAASLLHEFTTFVVTSPNPLANLDMPSASSVHLKLGTLFADPLLPVGLYTTNIGIYSPECFLPLPFPGGTGECNVTPNELPNFANAGDLTLRVSAIPEPSSVVFFGTALIGFLIYGYRKANMSKRPVSRATTGWH
jgi:hypothetical protein